jgi:K+-sensing histidine kinase KdpD
MAEERAQRRQAAILSTGVVDYSQLIELDKPGAVATLEERCETQGISPEFLPHVFEAFRQADPIASRVHGGLGLGLAIVHHLVTLHRGTVTVESAGVDQGCRVTASCPKSRSAGSCPRYAASR